MGCFLVGGRPERAVRGFRSKFVLGVCLSLKCIGPKVGQPRARPEHFCLVGWGPVTVVTGVVVTGMDRLFQHWLNGLYEAL